MRIAASILALVSVVACGQTGPTNPGSNPPQDVTLSVSVDVSAFSMIDQVVVEVTGPGIATPLVFNLTISAGTASGTVTVPAGAQRTFTLTAFDAAGIATHRGSVTVDVAEGTNALASVTMLGLQGDQPIVGHIGTLIVSIAPSSDTLIVGDTLRLTATVVDDIGDTLNVQVRWATLNPARAWVDTAGLVTALGSGTVMIVATYAGVGAAADLLINPTNMAALSFDGVAHYVEVPDANGLDVTSTWTIEAWVKPGNVAGAFQHVISKIGTGPDASYTLEINAGKLRSAIHDGVNPTQVVESSGTLTDNVWQHVAITLGSGTLSLYIDGVLDTQFAGSQIPNVSTRVLAFGRQSVGGQYYQGLIDEVRIWSVTRSGSEIAAAMNTHLTGSEAGFVGYWTFDEGAGDVAADATGNGHDGRLGSTVGPDANDPQWTTDAAPIP